MSDKINVLVSFKSDVSYSKEVEMTREQFDAINKRLDDNDRGDKRRRVSEDIFHELGFDLGDPSDYGDPELDDFMETVS